MADLDALPFPDYSDFPWHLYPNRIVPMLTGRGCGWGVCTFCSDVHTAAGRTWRTRSADNVLDEMRHQGQRHGTGVFTFLDLKLNSSLEVWRGLLDGAQRAVPGCEWTASVHVEAKGDNGLSREVLLAARKAGLSRLTTGLESASPRMLKAMGRGTSAEALSQFVRHAHEAGISVRMTTIIGYPGETAVDVDQTADFLRRHRRYLDRIVVNRLAIAPTTPLAHVLRRAPHKYPQIQRPRFDPGTALVEHQNRTFLDSGHFSAVRRMLWQVHRINRKPLAGASLTFEGVL